MGRENIEDYALVGDCHGCALVSRHASVDWLTLENFDADPLLWKILDNDSGAYIGVELSGQWQWSRQYLPATNILITQASNVVSVIKIYDFMPVGRNKESRTHDYTNLTALHAFVRRIEIEGASVELKVKFRNAAWPNSSKKLSLYSGFESISYIENDEFICEVTQKNPLYIVVSKEMFHSLHSQQLNQMFDVTQSFWQEWMAYSKYTGPYQKLINRSALTLKLLIHSPTGAIMAAATTSLPESLGGERNWDYRYCWLRDATFTLYALSYLGFSGEADGFCGYLNSVIGKNSDPIGVLYSIKGDSKLPEKIIKGVKGFMGSEPVRVGNDAYKQRQLDTFGEFMDWAYLHKQLGGTLGKELLRRIEETAELVKKIWKEKDRGLWEVRCGPEDFTYSKIMCWVALDRAQFLLNSPEKYQSDKEEIESFISQNCIFEGRLKRSAQSNDLDASLLLSKIVGYPIEDDVYDKTVTTIINELSDGPFIKRYKSKDGIQDPEGHFIICSFWVINAYLFLGKESQAKKMFDKLVTCFNDVGLLSEEYDAKSEHFLGNFPQALSHLAFIETASYFELYSLGGKEALTCSHGDRVRKLHTTLHGPRAVWDFMLKTRHFGKLLPSKKSILAWK